MSVQTAPPTDPLDRARRRVAAIELLQAHNAQYVSLMRARRSLILAAKDAGMTNAEIGHILNCSEGSVRNYFRRVPGEVAA